MSTYDIVADALHLRAYLYIYVVSIIFWAPFLTSALCIFQLTGSLSDVSHLVRGIESHLPCIAGPLNWQAYLSL